MDGGASAHFVVFDGGLVSELLSTEDESDHSDVNTLLLLELLFDLQHGVCGLEVEVNFSTGQSL